MKKRHSYFKTAGRKTINPILICEPSPTFLSKYWRTLLVLAVVMLMLSCANNENSAPEVEVIQKEVKLRDSLENRFRDSRQDSNFKELTSTTALQEPFYQVTKYKITYAADSQTPASFELTLRLSPTENRVVTRTIESSQVGTLLNMLNQCNVTHQLTRQGFIATPKNNNNAIASNR